MDKLENAGIKQKKAHKGKKSIWRVGLQVNSQAAERRMIMKKPGKQETKSTIQFCLLFTSCACGFAFQYSFIWLLVGLPKATWASLITTWMGILSASGLFAWISKN